MKLESTTVMRIYQLILILQIFAYVKTTHVQDAKVKILKKFHDALGPSENLKKELSDLPSSRTFQVVSHTRHHNRWNGRHKTGPIFTPWTAWGKCDTACKKSRTRYCKVKRKCGYTKHIEEKLCSKKSCHKRHTDIFRPNLTLEVPSAAKSNVPNSNHNLNNVQINKNPNTNTNNNNNNNKPHNNRIKTKHRPHYWLPVYEQIEDSSKKKSPADISPSITTNKDDEGDFFIIKRRKPVEYRKKRKQIIKEIISEEDDVEESGSNENDNNDDDDERNNDDDDEDNESGDDEYSSASSSNKNYNNKKKSKNKHDVDIDSSYNKKIIKSIRKEKWRRSDDDIWPSKDGGTEYNNKENQLNLKNPLISSIISNDDEEQDLLQLQGSIGSSSSSSTSSIDEYDDLDFENEFEQQSLNLTRVPQEKAVYDSPPKHRRAYFKWSEWSKCSSKCTTRRYKKCRLREVCGKEVLREIAYCYTEGSFCQQWLLSQNPRPNSYDLRPMASSRKDNIISQNSVFNDYVMSGKGYRGPEYQPMKLKCGIPSIKNNRRNMYNMLKIIGGKISRKGEWPWQVVIFNRFKEAFCGGTLIAPQWIITAAHCVRKVLYVRLGEHNLDFNDGTEIEFRVVRSFKHPNYDKKTVDSDIALLRLPRPVNATTYIGYSCLPRPYQKLPKNIQCTVIGWGKRRNRDQAGTSVLHQADVPIIPMENCKTVYKDYTITNNMFCAGHKRGRIDTCAGDSGGPLLCRDGTKPNHPWTIFGITSFGDGCAKRNKFGIYTKVPNYVDWIWSVVNCNGNCKPNTLTYR